MAVSELVAVAALPNPEGSDTGSEWLILQNSGRGTISLGEYSLSINGGSWYPLPAKEIKQGELVALVNNVSSLPLQIKQELFAFIAEIPFTLVNSPSELEIRGFESSNSFKYSNVSSGIVSWQKFPCLQTGYSAVSEFDPGMVDNYTCNSLPVSLPVETDIEASSKVTSNTGSNSATHTANSSVNTFKLYTDMNNILAKEGIRIYQSYSQNPTTAKTLHTIATSFADTSTVMRISNTSLAELSALLIIFLAVLLIKTEVDTYWLTWLKRLRSKHRLIQI